MRRALSAMGGVGMAGVWAAGVMSVVIGAGGVFAVATPRNVAWMGTWELLAVLGLVVLPPTTMGLMRQRRGGHERACENPAAMPHHRVASIGQRDANVARLRDGAGAPVRAPVRARMKSPAGTQAAAGDGVIVIPAELLKPYMQKRRSASTSGANHRHDAGSKRGIAPEQGVRGRDAA